MSFACTDYFPDRKRLQDVSFATTAMEWQLLHRTDYENGNTFNEMCNERLHREWYR